MGLARRVTGPAMHSSKSGLGAGAALGWNGMTRCVIRPCLGSSRDGRRSRWRAAWRWKLASRSSPMRASTASSTGRWLARRTTPGATTCPAPSPNGAGEVVEAAVRRRSFSWAGPLAERPQDEADCLTPGHWEADLMLFGACGQAVLTMHERHSRLCIAVRPGGKAAEPITSVMSQVLAPLPPRWRRTVTFDNGTEFARHYRLHACGIQTFFCDMHSPWQKGGVENAIGRLRRGLPRKTDWASEPEERFTQLVQGYNNTPRKCLGNRTPAEIFAREVLHLKCESTWCFVPSIPLFAGCGRILADFLGHKIGHLLLKSGRKRPTVGDIYDVNWRRGRPLFWQYICT